MPLPPKRLSDNGLKALTRAMGNAYRLFSARGDDPHSAGVRLRADGLCRVHHTAKFQVSASDAFFTIGSCFAREVEIALADLGCNLSLGDLVFPYDWFHPGHSALPSKVAGPDAVVVRERSPMNRYCTHSILYDFERVLEGKHSLQDSVIPLGSDERIWDPQLKNLQMGGWDEAIRARTVLDTAIGRMPTADVVILTLGMTETWYDAVAGAVLPTPPPPAYIKKFPERFSFFNADYDDVVATLETIVGKIRKHSQKAPKIIVTVSPVPMGSTFTGVDAFVANSYSKSTLVSAAQAVAHTADDVDYFPSYEMVVHSPREIWHDDAIHIRAPFVAEIMKRFIGCYFPTGA